jgi:hypothetical protein
VDSESATRQGYEKREEDHHHRLLQLSQSGKGGGFEIGIEDF